MIGTFLDYQILELCLSCPFIGTNPLPIAPVEMSSQLKNRIPKRFVRASKIHLVPVLLPSNNRAKGGRARPKKNNRAKPPPVIVEHIHLLHTPKLVGPLHQWRQRAELRGGDCLYQRLRHVIRHEVPVLHLLFATVNWVYNRCFVV
ncbi:hypothetical protein SLA2020_130030 [Shorea laevis]